MGIGQELLNVPMGDMIRQMAFAIADGQTAMDAASINAAEMMGGLTTVYDEQGKVAFDDSRIFFGYEYMTITEALAYAIIDDAFTGMLDADEAVKMIDLVEEAVKKSTGKASSQLTEGEKAERIRVPVRRSMMELGFAPTFYQFVDTIIEVKIAIKITRESEYGVKRSSTTKSTSNSAGFSFFGFAGKGSTDSNVVTSQVDASYSSKYSYSAEGASILRTKIVPVPVPAVLEARIRSFMETEEAVRQARLAEELKKTP
jgi:hypothetical protein